jgi:hypothetical protein
MAAKDAELGDEIVRETKILKAHLRDAQARAEKAEQEAAGLRASLEEYGEHAQSCPQHITYAHPSDGPACSCGLDAARARGGLAE